MYNNNKNNLQLKDVDVQQIEYHSATFKDVDNMNELNRCCLPENYPIYQWSILVTIMGKFCTVAYDNNILIGYVLCTLVCNCNDKIGCIASIAVHPKYRHLGIATKMLKRSIEQLETIPNLKEINLHVRQSNKIAQHLYEKMNFIESGIVNNYYEDGEDALVLTRPIL